MTNNMRLLAIGALTVSLMTPSIAAVARTSIGSATRTQIPAGVSVPQVQITSVHISVPGQGGGQFGRPTSKKPSTGSQSDTGNQSGLTGSKKPQQDGSKISVSWGAPQASPDDRIDFKRSVVTLEVQFSNGSRKVFSQKVDSVASATLPIDAPEGATPRSFKATVETLFKFRTAVATTRIFPLNTGAGSRPARSGDGAPATSGPHLPGGLPVTAITDAIFVSRCHQTQDCLTVKWTLQQPSPFPIDIFDVTADVTYQELTRRGTVDANKVTLSVSPLGVIDGSQNQASLIVSNPPVGFAATQINITLKTFFIPPEVKQIVQKEGRF